MADEVEHLVIAPFREIVEKANVAVENAKAAGEDVSAPMLKAAQSLAKEGDRALKKIEPLCNKAHEEYGCSFVDAIKEHDEIAQYRAELEDLLWDFDDFVVVEDFNADKFDELQKASRKAAPKVLDILKRMKLVKPTPETHPSSLPIQIDSPPSESSTQPVFVERPPSSEETMIEVEKQLSHMMGAQAGPDEGLNGMANSEPAATAEIELDRSNSHRSEVSEVVSEPPPPLPMTNPWEVGKPPPPPSPSAHSGDLNLTERRPPAPPPGDSPTLPGVYPLSTQAYPKRSPSTSQNTIFYNGAEPNYWQSKPMPISPGRNERLRTNSFNQHSPGDTRRPGYSSSNPQDATRYTQHYDSTMGGSRWSSRPASTGSVTFPLGSPTIPEHSAVNNLSQSNGYTDIRGPQPRQPLPSNPQPHAARQPSTDSFNSSIFDLARYDGASSPEASTQRTSSNISTTPGSPYSPSTQLPPQYTLHPTFYHNHSISTEQTIREFDVNQSVTTLTPSGLEIAGPVTYGQVDDAGLIPVDSEVPEDPSMPPRPPDCSIGPHSSFYQLKGFCKGAEEAGRGEQSFKLTQRPVGSWSIARVAKCKHCLFELEYSSVEKDLKNDSTGNYTSNSIGFRIRVLQKSHLQHNRIDEPQYGCVFCIHAGDTIEESDATVFFSQSQLFAHMARHPRPLPAVPGLTIVQGEEMPPHLSDNFDLWFPNPPMQSVMSGIKREVGKLPTAVASETRRNSNGILRSPPDRAAVLQFAVGAKIVGIEYPPRYEGKWGIGWHDGVRAAFEAESVNLNAPPPHEVRMQQAPSNMQAMARWKWKQGGEGNWLKFGKGDVIKNISWSYSDHWCWSGTTSKSWGIFPQSHIDPASIKLVIPGETSSISSAEKKNTFPRFAIRRNTDRKFGSFSSGSTESPRSRTHIY